MRGVQRACAEAIEVGLRRILLTSDSQVSVLRVVEKL